ncbi:TetR/AcrR family transcriptional regulator [Blastococcus sp. BMG 814]|uniref:TetR/AcrR family transcriptional regulator n=1 Tax=Blastococcus carthaginiensis TaxID=3050034 RepID=A0ABT9I835_9ACTN|nr:TetR/AcrR family transcriptional regulator [Blastococcus carthaginiensis]MDP5181731.1 TetR/AcrR family transcriptional regulator [Blastococcus carthaginiensis]
MAAAGALDRRQRRRQETIEEILDVAVAVMTEQGVAGLTLGEVARRMGIRPPSLYGYFDGKHALYDALFERGWRALQRVLEQAGATGDGADPLTAWREGTAVLVRWAVEHPAHSALMFWRPVPGFTPSARAYEPAVELDAASRVLLVRLRDAGHLAADVDVDRAYRTWTALVGGVISQQLSNAPDEPFESGTFTAVLPDVMDMWLGHHRSNPSAR